MKKAQLNILIQIIVFVVLAGFYSQLAEIPDETKGYPTFLLVACAVINTVILVSYIPKLRSEEAPEKNPELLGMLKRVIVYIFVLGLYIFLIEKISYILSTLLFTIASLQIMGHKSWKMKIILPVILTVSAYIVFSKGLSISMPSGTWIHFSF
ncbi:MAG: Tripartite tricarboxylate transporter TctB family [Clostridiales bacterium]|jgi:lysylphosphatidylglycerol synthetase-like protein (DUF2156 family)|nr:Tripartite tricarboxylate transporter TctB family [Clostridiales bacterium]